MGGKTSKDSNSSSNGSSKPVIVPSKDPNKLTDDDFIFLENNTNLSRSEIQTILEKFNANNPDGKLDKKEFSRLYIELRPESPQLITNIADYVFKGFDTDNSGYINFSEFLISYALTTRGDMRKKLEYAFDIYDIDRNGFLDKKEVSQLLVAMIDLLGKFFQFVLYLRIFVIKNDYFFRCSW